MKKEKTEKSKKTEKVEKPQEPHRIVINVNTPIIPKSEIKSKAALDFLEELEEIDLTLVTKYEIVGVITYLFEHSMITYDEYCYMLDYLDMTEEELSKTYY